jgi:hypothetical protein
MADEQNGFEWRNRVYPWSVSDIGKDLMLIDRIAQIPPSDFIELVSDADQNERAPVLLALVATSLRAGHPDWSVDRIYRIVMNLSLTQDITFLSEGDDEHPPPVEAATPPTSEGGRSPSNGSSPPSTPPEPSTLPTSSVTPL